LHSDRLDYYTMSQILSIQYVKASYYYVSLGEGIPLSYVIASQLIYVVLRISLQNQRLKSVTM